MDTTPPTIDNATLLAVTDFARSRLLGTLDAIEKSSREAGRDLGHVLAWRPGPGRAHVGWQAMHCAATHDRYLHAAVLNVPPSDPALVAAFAGGSTPSDENVPTLEQIRAALATHYATYRAFIARATPADLARTHKLPNGTERRIGESLVLLAWHEGHHQGQIHLTWNLYQGAHAAK